MHRSGNNFQLELGLHKKAPVTGTASSRMDWKNSVEALGAITKLLLTLGKSDTSTFRKHPPGQDCKNQEDTSCRGVLLSLN